MLKKHRLVIDTFSEIFNLLEPWADEIFWDFSQIQPQPKSIYVVGRQQYLDNTEKFQSMCKNGDYVMIFNTSAEGSWTAEMQIKQLHLDQLIREKKLFVVSGAEISDEFPCLTHEYFLSKILDFDENLEAQQHTKKIFDKKNKPYQFLFLNGRARPHRKYLYERFRSMGMLSNVLWTMLDSKPPLSGPFVMIENGQDQIKTISPLQRLPDHYEVHRYRAPSFGPIVPGRSMLKQELFRTQWGEIYLQPEPYIDTYFSLVTETVCAESTISFRTEKIAKPLAIGHPFVVASTRGFYRDLRNLGFRTFDHIIDETFDLIDDAQDRMDRLIEVVQDLCKQDLDHFIAQCQDSCKYNQQRLAELKYEVHREFPEQFFQFIQSNERS